MILFAAFYSGTLGTLAPVDRDESRFAEASRQMFESAALPGAQRDLAVDERGAPRGLHAGGWAVPMFGHEPRLTKPPLIYWLQTASAWCFSGGEPGRDAIWMYRVPSMLAALGAAAGTVLLGRRMFAPGAALLAGVLLALAPMVMWEAHQARSDALLMLCTVLSQGALWGVWARRGRSGSVLAGVGRAALFWLALGVGILAKGPITPMVAGLTVVALCITMRVRGEAHPWRWMGRLHGWLALPILALVLAPWLIAIDHAVGLETFARVSWDEFVVRGTTGSREGHFAPPGFHVLLGVGLLFPASVWIMPALARAWRRGRVRGCSEALRKVSAPDLPARRMLTRLLPKHRRDAELFLLAWLVPAWIVFELSPAKLPHYTLPLYPAACLLAGRFAAARLGQRVAAVRAGLTARRRSAVNVAAGLAVFALVMFAVFAALGALPIPGSFTARLMAPIAARWPEIVFSPGAGAAPPFASVYHEDSMVFWSRGRVERIHTLKMSDWLADHRDGVAVIDAEQLPEAEFLGFRSIASMPGKNSTKPRGERDTVLHVVAGPGVR
ncbi:hypothetical protein BH11PLA1_BH11PLA1_23910 [soil metagenome]